MYKIFIFQINAVLLNFYIKLPTLWTVVYIFKIQNWNETEVHFRCFLHCYWHFTQLVQKSAIITWMDVRAVDSAHADDIYKSSWRTGPIFKPESCLNPIGPLSPSTFLSRYSPINKCPKTPIRKKGGEQSYFPCNATMVGKATSS